MERATLSDILREVKHAPELHDRLARIVYNLGGGRVPFVLTTTALNNLVNAVETVMLTTPPLNPGLDSAIVLLLASAAVGPIGTSGTALVTRFRQGTGITGTVAGFSTTTTTVAGNSLNATQIGIDTPGAVAGLQYSFTGSVTAGATNSTVGTGLMIALALG